MASRASSTDNSTRPPIDLSAVMNPGIPQFLAFKELGIQPVSLPVEAYQPERRAGILDAYLDEAKSKLKAAEAPILKMKQTLIAALRQEADLLAADEPGKTSASSDATNSTSLTHEAARLAVDDA